MGAEELTSLNAGYGYAVSASPARDCVPTAFLPRAKAGVSSGES
jgi:hypothetical protein